MNTNAVATPMLNSRPTMRPPRPARLCLNSRPGVPGALSQNVVANCCLNSKTVMRLPRPATHVLNSTTRDAGRSIQCGRHGHSELHSTVATAAPGPANDALQRRSAGRSYSECGRHPPRELHLTSATAAPGHPLDELQLSHAGRTISTEHHSCLTSPKRSR